MLGIFLELIVAETTNEVPMKLPMRVLTEICTLVFATCHFEIGVKPIQGALLHSLINHEDTFHG